MDLWEVLKASKGVPITSDMYDALFGKALGGAGSVWETESAPYFFRQSGGVLNSRLLGKEKDTIVGASVGFNQLVENNANNWGQSVATYTYDTTTRTATLNGTAVSSRLKYMNFATVQNHIYIVSATVSSDSNGTMKIESSRGWQAKTVAVTTTPTRQSVLLKLTSATDSDQYLQFYKVINTDTAYTLVIKDAIAIDLTQMLGSTIADYVYTLESGTAGAGIAWLKSYGFFGLPYYAYDSGSIKSVSGLVRHEMKDENDNVIGSYPLDSTLELRGLFKMDADHNIYAEGDTYEADGTVTRKYASVDLGSLDWTYVGVYNGFFYSTGISSVVANGYYCVANGYVNANLNSTAIENNDKAIGINANDSGNAITGAAPLKAIIITNRAYTDAPTFKTAMNGVYLVYELATPTTEQAEPFASPQNVDKAGTEEYVTNQNFVPIGHETQYKCEPTP